MSNLSQFVKTIAPSSNITLNPLCVSSLTICENGSVLFTKSLQGPNNLGCYYEGGHVICKAASVSWIVAPRCAEVTRTWTLINDANTVANLCTGCTGWFVPTVTQLQNPGYTCRTYWDSFSSTGYWSSTEYGAPFACRVSFGNGSAYYGGKAGSLCVRAFRCVTY